MSTVSAEADRETQRVACGFRNARDFRVGPQIEQHLKQKRL